MRPDEPLDRERVGPLFDAGRWREAEELLRALTEADEQDLAACCQLATLLALRGWEDDPGRRDLAVKLYDDCAVQGWAPGLCLNNQGVVWAQDRQAMPAVAALNGAHEKHEGYGPALYNLGILCQRIADAGGGVPRLLVDTGVVAPDEDPRAASRRYLAAALDDVAWAAGGGGGDAALRLQEPLHLWVDDLSPALGWLPGVDDRHHAEAEEQLQEGLKLLAAHDFERAMARFQSAVDLVPEFGPRVTPHRIRAVRGHLDVLRRDARGMWREGRFDEARTALDGLLATLPHLPDRRVGLQTIVDEVAYRSAELRALLPGGARDRLQHLLATLGHLLEEYAGRYEDTRQWAVAHDPAGAREVVWLRARDPETLGAEMRTECAGVLWREVWNAVDGRDDEAVEPLLTLPGTVWLGDEVRRIRREAYLRLARRRLADAQRSDLDRSQRIDALLSARSAAGSAGDQGLVKEIDDHLRGLSAHDADVTPEIREAFDGGLWLRVLRLCAAFPPSAQPTHALEAMRAVAWTNQLDWLDQALKATTPAGANRRQAYRVARFLARLHPEDDEVGARLEEARQRWLGERLRRAEQRLRDGDLDRAQARLDEARRVDPASDAVLDLSFRLEEARVNAEAQPAKEVFDRAAREFGQARAAGDPLAAVGAYRAMRRFPPGALHAEQAAAWLFPALLRELDHQGVEAFASVRGELDLVLRLEEDRSEARELRSRLVRADTGIGGEAPAWDASRMEAVEELIARAGSAASERPPRYDLMLQALADTPEYGPDEEQRTRIARLRDRALHGAEQRFERLLQRFRADDEAEARALVEVMEPEDRDLAARMRQRLETLLRAAEPPEDPRDAVIRALQARVDQARTGPWEAWRAVVGALEANPELRGDPRVEGLRAGLFARLSPLRRAQARLHEWLDA